MAGELSGIEANTYTLRYQSTGNEEAVIFGSTVVVTNGNGKVLMVQDNAGHAYAYPIVDIKAKIQDKENISPDLYQLVFNGTVLEDEKRLSDYSINKDSTLTLNQIVQQVSVTINEPKGGQTLSTEATCATTGVSAVTLKWTDIMNNPVSGVEESTLNDDGTLMVVNHYDSNKDKLTDITAPGDIIVPNGTQKTVEALGLPAQVDIATNDNSVSRAAVTWDLDNLLSGSYDPALKTEQTFEVHGTITYPVHVDVPVDIQNTGVSIQVTVQAQPTQITSITVTPVAATVQKGKVQQFTSTVTGTGVFSEDVIWSVEGETATVTVTEIPVTKYQVTVTNGTGAGEFESGATITVTANKPEEGKELKLETMPDYKITDGGDSDWAENSQHSFEIVWNDGFASTSFTVKEVTGGDDTDTEEIIDDGKEDEDTTETTENEDKKPEAVETDDTTPLALYVWMMFASGCGIICVIAKKRKA